MQMTDRSTDRLRGFTRIDLLVLVLMLLLLFGVLLPVLQLTRRSVDTRAVNDANVRALHLGELVFAASNNHWGPGFDRDGKLDIHHVFNGEPQSDDWGGYNQSMPRAPAWRLRRLLENGYFTGEHCINRDEQKAIRQFRESMDPSKFSYAMLKIEGDDDSPRKREHRGTNNPLAAVISDRAITNGSGYRSVWTSQAGPDVVLWHGTVCWGDNHATFEEKSVLDTKYDEIANTNDNLFTDSNPSGQPNAEAAMAWKSAGDTDAELVE